MVMLDYSGSFPYFGVCPRLHTNFGSRLDFFHALVCMMVMILLLTFFSLVQVPGDFLLVVALWLKQALHHRQLISQSTTHE